MKRAAQTLDRVDIFVSNAGTCPCHAFVDMAHALERTMVMNRHRAIYMVQTAVNQLVREGGGSTVAVSPVSALIDRAMWTRCMSIKGRMNSLMRSVAFDHRRW